MKTLKQISLLCLFWMIGMSTWAYDFYDDDWINYNILSESSLTCAVTYDDKDGFLYEGDVVIPSTVNYMGKTYSVVAIGASAFKNCPDLTSVTIPSSIITINEEAFYGCTGITEITIPDGVETIPASAFKGCTKLNTITFGTGVKTIESDAFSGCNSLAEVTIPNTVTAIGDRAFYGCNALTTIVVSTSLNTIGTAIFDGTAWYNSLNDGDLIYVGNYLLGYKGDTKPSGNIQIKSGTSIIADGAFYDCCNIAALRLPTSIRIIGNNAFQGCNALTSLTLPEGLNAIGREAFKYCSGIADLSVSTTVNSIGIDAFENCSNIKYVKIKDLEAWCNLIFPSPYSNPMANGGKLYINNEQPYDITIPESITSIHQYAFYGLQCHDFTMPNSIKNIGTEAFVNLTCNNFVMSNSVNSIGPEAFRDAHMSTINIPASIRTVGDGAFAYASIGTLTIPDIESWCKIDFKGTIPGKKYGWEQCSNPMHNASVVCGVDGKPIRELIVPEGVTHINNLQFYDLKIQSLKLPNTLVFIGNRSFAGIGYQKNVTIPNSVEIIDEQAFMENHFESITIGSSLKEIKYSAFGNFTCEKVYFTEESLKNWCSVILPVHWHENPIHIAHHIYVNGVEVKDLIIPEGVEKINEHVFRHCSSLESVTIPSTVKEIGKDAFVECENLNMIGIMSHDNTDEVRFHIDVLDKTDGDTHQFWSSLDIKTFNNIWLYQTEPPVNWGWNENDVDFSNTQLHVLSDAKSLYSNDDNYNCFQDIEDIKYAESISFDKSDLSVDLGSTAQIQASIFPVGSYPILKWTSSNPDVAYVASGVVYARKVGTAIITATTLDGTKRIATCEVVVNSVPVASIAISKKSFSLEIGETETLTAVAQPDNATKKDIEWQSSDESIATVEGGLVKAISPGTVQIVAKATDGSGVSASCTVSVIGYYNFMAQDANGESINEIVRTGDVVTLMDTYKTLKVTEDIENVDITYSRTFKYANWLPWYVPFDMPYTSELASEFSFATLAGALVDDEDGQIYVCFSKIMPGDIVKGNAVYMVKAADATQYATTPKTFAVNDATLLSTNYTLPYQVQSANYNFKFNGLYEPKVASAEDMDWYYYNTKFQYCPAAANTKVGAFRFIFSMAERSDSPYLNGSLPLTVGLKVDMEDVTAIEEITENAAAPTKTTGVFNVNGVKVADGKEALINGMLPAGIYVIDGKKVFIK